MDGVLFQQTTEDHVVVLRDTHTLSLVESTSLLPLRGFRLKSFGNLNKSEEDADIDPLWSPTMTTDQDIFRHSSKELPVDLLSSPSSASDYSLFPHSMSSPTYDSLPGVATTAARYGHYDPVADQTQEDFFFECEPNLCHPTLPHSPSASQNFLSPFWESDSPRDYSPLSMQTTVTPPEPVSFHVDGNILIKSSTDLSHSEDFAVIGENGRLEVPPIMITPCEDIDDSRPQPLNNRHTLSIPRLPTTKRRRGSATSRIINWRSSVDTCRPSVASGRNLSVPRTHIPFPEITRQPKDEPTENDNESVISFSDTSEVLQSSTVLDDGGFRDERSGGEEYHSPESIPVSYINQPPANVHLRISDNVPVSPLTRLSTVLQDLDVSEAFTDPVPQLKSAPRSESASPRQNPPPVTITCDKSPRGKEAARALPSSSHIKERRSSPGTSNEGSSEVSIPTPYLLRARFPTTTASRAADQNSSEDDHDEVTWRTKRGKRKSARKASVSVKTEETDDDSFTPLKRQIKRARGAAPTCSKRRRKTRPSTTKHAPQTYNIPDSDKSKGWHALKMADGRFACNKCGIGFNRRHDLGRHWQASCTERPDMDSKLICHLCGKGESRKDALDRHLKTVHKR